MEGENAGSDDAVKNYVEASSSLGLPVRGYRPELIALCQPCQRACEWLQQNQDKLEMDKKGGIKLEGSTEKVPLQKFVVSILSAPCSVYVRL